MAACSGGGASGPKPFNAMSGEEHLACAVDISAYTYLTAAKTIPEDRDMLNKSVLALAWHHNAYALPQGEKEQYDLINKKRLELIGRDAAEAIAGRAVGCIEVALAKHEADQKRRR
ncbi:MAG: hypothetical protein EAY70_09080 [Sphingomonadales bacterium]|nr:MAG: hypothetical protein EAY70_09080 [Sphingomonadales bacterium]